MYIYVRANSPPNRGLTFSKKFNMQRKTGQERKTWKERKTGKEEGRRMKEERGPYTNNEQRNNETKWSRSLEIQHGTHAKGEIYSSCKAQSSPFQSI